MQKTVVGKDEKLVTLPQQRRRTWVGVATAEAAFPPAQPKPAGEAFGLGTVELCRSSHIFYMRVSTSLVMRPTVCRKLPLSSLVFLQWLLWGIWKIAMSLASCPLCFAPGLPARRAGARGPRPGLGLNKILAMFGTRGAPQIECKDVQSCKSNRFFGSWHYMKPHELLAWVTKSDSSWWLGLSRGTTCCPKGPAGQGAANCHGLHSSKQWLLALFGSL